MNEKTNMESKALVEKVLSQIAEKKGENTKLVNLKKVSSLADYFIITTGNSSVHVRAIADEIHEKLKKNDNVIPWHMEGYEGEKWILLDYVDVVVHVFDNSTRQYYSLEKLWEDADITEIEPD